MGNQILNVNYDVNNIYVLDYNNTFLKKIFKYKNFYKILFFLSIDICLLILIYGINFLICSEKYHGDFTFMSSYFCEFIWILFLLFEYFNIINKYKIFVNLEKTFLIKKESMIAIIRVNNGVNLGLPLSVLLADSMTLTTFYAEEMFSNEINKYKKELKKHILNIYHKNLDKYTSKIYTNCSLIFETENYCLYSGEITDKKNKRRIEKFKVYKVYSNASNFLDGGVNNV